MGKKGYLSAPWVNGPLGQQFTGSTVRWVNSPLINSPPVNSPRVTSLLAIVQTSNSSTERLHHCAQSSFPNKDALPETTPSVGDNLPSSIFKINFALELTDPSHKGLKNVQGGCLLPCSPGQQRSHLPEVCGATRLKQVT